MNILFLTLSNFEDLNVRGIHTDLVREMGERGINVCVVSPRQKRENKPTELFVSGTVMSLRVKTGNITKTKSIFEKGMSTLLIERQYLKAIKKYFGHIKFDMVLYSTPPITFNKVVSHYKNSQGSKTYLMLKDIFPQNAVDMGLIRKGSLLWRYFRKKETDLYRISDFIGCMSQGNVDYILKNNKYLKRDKLEIFPNSIKPIEKTAVVPKDDKILEKYNIPRNTTLFVYGGNLGKPQGVDFLLKVADEFHKVEKGCLVIVGSGTEFDRIYSHVEIKKLKNVVVLERLPKDEYDSLMRMADVGLVFLDRRFTIPNFPSRLTSYMENSLPIIAATDTVTDIRQTIVESNSGFWCESGDLETFISYAQRLSEDKGLKMRMGNNSRKFLEENYDVTKNLDIILNHLSEGDIDDV